MKQGYPCMDAMRELDSKPGGAGTTLREINRDEDVRDKRVNLCLRAESILG